MGDEPSLALRQRLFMNLMTGRATAPIEEVAEKNGSKFDNQRCVTHVSNPCDDSNQIVLLNVPTGIAVASVEPSVCGKEVPPTCQLASVSQTALPSKQVTSRRSNNQESGGPKPTPPQPNKYLNAIMSYSRKKINDSAPAEDDSLDEDIEDLNLSNLMENEES
jgi:hypothetical protein